MKLHNIGMRTKGGVAGSEEFIEYDPDPVRDGIAHVPIQHGTLECQHLALGEEGSCGWVDIVPRELNAVHQEGSPLAEHSADVRLGDG